MSNPVWPGGLPQAFFRGVGLQPRVSFDTFAVDAGPAKRRSAFGAPTDIVTGPLKLTKAEYVIFKNFYNDTLAYGALEFDWIDPVSELATTYRFLEPVSFAQEMVASGFFFLGEMTLERQP